MGHISNKLAARFSAGGKHRRPIREEAKLLRESTRILKDVKGIKQLVREGLNPLHAFYVAVQNFTSVFAENVSVFDEFEPYYQILLAAEDEYMPGGPPISPLTHSYFTREVCRMAAASTLSPCVMRHRQATTARRIAAMTNPGDRRMCLPAKRDQASRGKSKVTPPLCIKSKSRSRTSSLPSGGG
jgi:hypothetical protein